MVRGQAAAVVVVVGGRKRVFLIQRERRAFLSGASRNAAVGAARSPASRRCLGDWKRRSNGSPGAGGARLASAGLETNGCFLGFGGGRCLAAEKRGKKRSGVGLVGSLLGFVF